MKNAVTNAYLKFPSRSAVLLCVRNNTLQEMSVSNYLPLDEVFRKILLENTNRIVM